jgi:vancomycin permeability regulator SanA
MKSLPMRVLIGAISIAAALLLVTSLAICIDGLRDREGRADVGVVLGNKVETSGMPSARLAARLDKAVELYRRGDFPVVIVSGGRGREGYDEGVVMRGYLIGKGVPAASIIVDLHGDTTMRTAENSAAIMRTHGYRSAFLISQYFHISRTRLAFSRCGIDATYNAHARHFEARDLFAVPRDAIGYLSYLAFARCRESG